jgi:predicted transcriptional regulator
VDCAEACCQIRRRYEGSSTAFAESLGVSPEAIRLYLEGSAVPAGPVLARLLRLAENEEEQRAIVAGLLSRLELSSASDDVWERCLAEVCTEGMTRICGFLKLVDKAREADGGKQCR